LVTFAMTIRNDNLRRLQFKHHKLADYYRLAMGFGNSMNLS
jgi:hypothetical protein